MTDPVIQQIIAQLRAIARGYSEAVQCGFATP